MVIQHKQGLLWVKHLLIIICTDKAKCQLLELTQVCIPKQQICRKMFYLNSHL